MLTVPYHHFLSSQKSCLAIGSMSFDIRVKLTGLLISFSSPSPHFARQILLRVPLGCFILSKCSEMITNWLDIFFIYILVVFSNIFSKAVGSTFDVIGVMPKYSLVIDLKKLYRVFSFNYMF